VGIGHPLATTAIDVAAVLDTVDFLGGRPIIALRYSDADGRERHRGVSHHSRTALELTRCIVDVPVPEGMDLAFERHRVATVTDVDVPTLLAKHGLRVTSMGRGPEDDPRFYAVAGAAGTLASLV
jgi:hypothetical protein